LWVGVGVRSNKKWRPINLHNMAQNNVAKTRWPHVSDIQCENIDMFWAQFIWCEFIVLEEEKVTILEIINVKIYLCRKIKERKNNKNNVPYTKKCSIAHSFCFRFINKWLPSSHRTLLSYFLLLHIISTTTCAVVRPLKHAAFFHSLNFVRLAVS
jgi:hypothetical protein